jgi:phosphoribosylglycinamide formyltransferase-1
MSAAARKRVAVLISGRGSNMSALIEAAKPADYPAEIALVLSNVPDAGGLSVARNEGIATAVIDHRTFGRDRQAFEAAVQAELEARRIDLVCLAGFMRLLTPWLIGHWPQRMLNIHPALLPKYKGLHTHERALAAGEHEHGASVHFVVPEMDAGPIIAQGRVPVLPDDDATSLAARVLTVEHKIYPLALRLTAQERVRVEGGVCKVAGPLSAEDAAFILGATR